MKCDLYVNNINIYCTHFLERARNQHTHTHARTVTLTKRLQHNRIYTHTLYPRIQTIWVYARRAWSQSHTSTRSERERNMQIKQQYVYHTFRIEWVGWRLVGWSGGTEVWMTSRTFARTAHWEIRAVLAWIILARLCSYTTHIHWHTCTRSKHLAHCSANSRDLFLVFGTTVAPKNVPVNNAIASSTVYMCVCSRSLPSLAWLLDGNML